MHIMHILHILHIAYIVYVAFRCILVHFAHIRHYMIYTQSAQPQPTVTYPGPVAYWSLWLPSLTKVVRDGEKRLPFLVDLEQAQAILAIKKLFRSGPISWAGHCGHCLFETLRL
jgi:hypothetical protein